MAGIEYGFMRAEEGEEGVDQIDTPLHLRVEVLAPHPDDRLYDLGDPQDLEEARARFGCVGACMRRAASSTARTDALH